jgi:molecular chaperone GrpE
MTHAAISLQNDLRKLQPVTLSEGDPAAEGKLPAGVLEELSKNLAKLAKHQFRATQSMEAMAEACRRAEEQAEEHRRSAARMAETRRQDAIRLLGIVDAVDDAAIVARQIGDARWTERLDRLASRLLQTLAGMGVSEIPARGNPFNEELHEALETVPQTPESGAGTVHEVVSRGFLYEGRVVRRAQVITTR